jgi:bifunctional UDP-N-acetylglucosamine pyrophosphorylase/glucosamine-1-phosphate N-acetyltransferase
VRHRALSVVILAAGKGTRMKSARPKVLHPLAGRPLIDHILRTVASLQAATTVVVIGPDGGDVKAALSASSPDLQFVVQSPQLGTGHAVLQADAALAGRSGTLLVLYADVPLLEANTLRRLVEHHTESRAAATVLSTTLPDPYGYGRIVRDADGQVARIVEERDASAAEREIREVNTGIYGFDLAPLFGALHELAADHAQAEYYLTELVAAYRQRGRGVESLCLDAPLELRSVNTRADLADLTRALRHRKNRALMLAGVTLDDPATAYIDEDVVVGADTVIGPNVQLEGRTVIGARCAIGAGSRLAGATLADDVTILNGCVIVASTVSAGAQVGPYAHLRPGSDLGDQARVGNFVELKKTRLGRGSKANHLAYLGDATIGDHVNVGAGTITCNYDGEKKHPTVIEDGVFIGSDSQLVAPVTVGRNAYVAAGSTVTRDVPADALAIARARQENKPDWAARRRAQRQADKD